MGRVADVNLLGMTAALPDAATAAAVAAAHLEMGRIMKFPLII